MGLNLTRQLGDGIGQTSELTHSRDERVRIFVFQSPTIAFLRFTGSGAPPTFQLEKALSCSDWQKQVTCMCRKDEGQGDISGTEII